MMWDNTVGLGFDVMTLILYIFLSMVLIVCLKGLRASQTDGSLPVIHRMSYAIRSDIAGVIGLWIALVFLCVFRMVNDNGVGGADVTEYIRRFQYGWAGSEKISLEGLLKLRNGEPFLYMYFDIMRSVTRNFRVMFLIYYGFVAYCYLSFACYYYRNYHGKIAYVGVPLFFGEFLYSFSVMRFGLGVAFLLLGMRMYGQSRRAGTTICLVCAVLSHLTMVIPVASLMFESCVKRTRTRKRFHKRGEMIVAFVVTEAALCAAMPFLRVIIMYTKFEYAGNGGLSVRGQLIYFMTGILTLYFYDDLKEIFQDNIWIVNLELIDVALIPMLLNFDAYRIHNMFVGIKLLLFGGLLMVIKKRFVNKTFVKYGGYLISYAYFIFRFYRGSFPTPYILDLF